VPRGRRRRGRRTRPTRCPFACRTCRARSAARRLRVVRLFRARGWKALLTLLGRRRTAGHAEAKPTAARRLGGAGRLLGHGLPEPEPRDPHAEPLHVPAPPFHAPRRPSGPAGTHGRRARNGIPRRRLGRGRGCSSRRRHGLLVVRVVPELRDALRLLLGLALGRLEGILGVCVGVGDRHGRHLLRAQLALLRAAATSEQVGLARAAARLADRRRRRDRARGGRGRGGRCRRGLVTVGGRRRERRLGPRTAVGRGGEEGRGGAARGARARGRIGRSLDGRLVPRRKEVAAGLAGRRVAVRVAGGVVGGVGDDDFAWESASVSSSMYAGINRLTA
jgi:hypothetical protein